MNNSRISVDAHRDVTLPRFMHGTTRAHVLSLPGTRVRTIGRLRKSTAFPRQ
jgi:hypothetical protein